MSANKAVIIAAVIGAVAAIIAALITAMSGFGGRQANDCKADRNSSVTCSNNAFARNTFTRNPDLIGWFS